MIGVTTDHVDQTIGMIGQVIGKDTMTTESESGIATGLMTIDEIVTAMMIIGEVTTDMMIIGEIGTGMIIEGTATDMLITELCTMTGDVERNE